MKKQMIATVLVGSMMLAGCSSGAAETTKDNSSQDISVTESEQETNSENSDVAASEFVNYFDISDMTPEEIVNEIIYYYENRPVQGDTYEKICSTFKVEPYELKTSDTSVSALYMEEGPRPTSDEGVFYITYYGFKKSAEDGSIETGDRSALWMNIRFKSLDRAKQVYELLADYYVNVCDEDEVWTDYYKGGDYFHTDWENKRMTSSVSFDHTNDDYISLTIIMAGDAL